MSTRKNKSDVWKHFTKVAGGAKAQCKLCEKELPTLGGNTTGLHNQLRTEHTNCVEADRQQSKLHSFGIGPQRSCSDQQQDKITDMLSGPTLIACRMPHVCLPCAVSQSAQFPSPHSARHDATDAIIKRRRRPLRRYSWSDRTTSPKYGNTESLFSGLERHSQNR